MLEQVNKYIDEAVVNSYIWDSADDRTRNKAINRALMLLELIVDTEGIDVAVVAEQALWVLKLDDTISRAEMGVTNIMLDGTMISIRHKDTSYSPVALRLLGIPVTAGGRVRKIGAYRGYYGSTQRWGSTAYKTVKAGGKNA